MSIGNANRARSPGPAIEGRKGGKGGAPPPGVPPQEAPNTLTSIATARVIDVISEGEIVGLVDGAKSIFLDSTPLQDQSGDYNFQGFSYEERFGLPDQDHISGYAQTESEIAVGVEVTNPTPVTRTVTDPDLDAVRVKIRIPALQKTDSTTGDTQPTSVSFDISVKPFGGVYSTAVNGTISGKTTSPYERSYRIEMPSGGAPWDVRVTRITADSTTSTLINATFWSSYTEVIDAKLTYPDTAMVAVSVDAEQFGTTVPQRAYEIKGLKVQIPSNYFPGDPPQYVGIWDGTFKTEWSDNPAWVLYDLVTNNRYGLGDVVDPTQVDKWGLYTISQYCDEMVDDGFGGTERRFTFNGVINAREEAYNVVNAIASAFRGMVYWSSGAVYAAQDSPADPVKLVSPANALGGDFNYMGSALKARHTVALVSWNDPADAYKATIAVVENADEIAKLGWRQIDVVAFGCTSKGQATRFGRWILDSERVETETVTYRAALDHADVRPGDIIALADPAYAGVRFGGRAASATTTQITLDGAVTLESGETYTLSVVLPDGTLEDQPVTTGPGSVSVLDLAAALSDTPLVGAMWVLTASNVEPRKFRVLAVREVEKNIFEVTALFHDPTKFDRVEQNLILEEPDYSALPTGPLGTPSDLTTTEYLYQAGPAVKSAVTFSWTAPSDPRVVYFGSRSNAPVKPASTLSVIRPGFRSTYWTP